MLAAYPKFAVRRGRGWSLFLLGSLMAIWISFPAAVPAAVPEPSVRPPPGTPDPPPVPPLWMPIAGAVVRGFDTRAGPFGPGHRGIDIAAPFGTVVVASAKGTVSFAGFVAGSLFVTIQHADGIRTTYSWLSGISVKVGDQVTAQQPIGWSGHGHPEVSTPHLHFGVRVDTTYVDPLRYLRPGDVVDLIRLAPLQDAEESGGT